MDTTIDWPAFIARHEMQFDALPDRWEEAPHFGNALVGSMLYMRDGRLCLEVFRADVCDHRDEGHGWTAYSRPRFRIGWFSLETAGVPIGCKWRKNLWNAELTGTLSTDRGDLAIRHFVHADDMEIVTELTPSDGEAELKWTWHPFEARTSRSGYPRDGESRQAFAKRYGEHYLDTIKPPVDNPAGRLETRGDVFVWVQDLWAGGAVCHGLGGGPKWRYAHVGDLDRQHVSQNDGCGRRREQCAADLSNLRLRVCKVKRPFFPPIS